MSFKNKVILITGAASGIGADASIRFAKLGAKIAMVDLNGKSLKEVAEQIKSFKPLTIAADVTKDAKRIIDETIKHFDKLDILINCAGIIKPGGLIDLKIEEFDTVLNVNVRSMILLSQMAVPHLEKTKGNIVNLSSVAGRCTMDGGVLAYCLSKAAVDQFTKCTATELAPKGIRVNAVCPGIIYTPILAMAGEKPEMVRRHLNEFVVPKYPIGRVGEVDDITNVIAFLADDTASFITGNLFLVDGGYSIRG